MKPLLRLPDPRNAKPEKKKPRKCRDCKGELALSIGQGYCPECKRMIALPVGYVLSFGRNQRKPVYFGSKILEDFLQDMTLDEAYEELYRELKNGSIFVIDEKRYSC